MLAHESGGVDGSLERRKSALALLLEDLIVCIVSKYLTWSIIQLPYDVIKVVVRERAEVHSLGQISPEESVGVFVGAALIGGVRPGEVSVLRAVKSRDLRSTKVAANAC